MRGTPCLDEVNRRAYIANGSQLYSFDTGTFLPAGTFALPVAFTDDWRQTCVRWGLDGFALLGPDGNAYVGRWSAIPANTDSNGDGLVDAWELIHFGKLQVDPGADGDGDGMCNVPKTYSRALEMPRRCCVSSFRAAPVFPRVLISTSSPSI